MPYASAADKKRADRERLRAKRAGVPYTPPKSSRRPAGPSVAPPTYGSPEHSEPVAPPVQSRPTPQMSPQSHPDPLPRDDIYDDEDDIDFSGGDTGPAAASPDRDTGGKVIDPPQQDKTRKPPSEWNTPDSSMLAERLSFSVTARFMYDGWKVKNPLYKGSFSQWIQEMLWVAWDWFGAEPAVIWREPGSPPISSTVQPFVTTENMADIIEDAAAEEVSIVA